MTLVSGQRPQGVKILIGGVDQLIGGFGAPPTFHLVPLSFEYSARQKCIPVLCFGGRL